MYFYSNHLSGGIYYNEEELDFEELYCVQCGDSDWLLSELDTQIKVSNATTFIEI